MTDPLVLRHGLYIRADQVAALTLESPDVEDSYLDLSVGDNSTGRFGNLYLGADGADGKFNASLYATGSAGSALEATIATQYDATGGAGGKSKILVRAGIGVACNDSGVDSEVRIESLNQSSGLNSGESRIYINALNFSTDHAVSDSLVSISAPGHVDLSANGFDDSYLKLYAGRSHRSVNMWFGKRGASDVVASIPPQVSGVLDGSAVVDIIATNDSGGLTLDTYGAYSNFKSYVGSNVTLQRISSSIEVVSENWSTPPSLTDTGLSSVLVYAKNDSTDSKDYRFVDNTVLELKSDAQINLEAEEDFGFITLQGGNTYGAQKSQTRVDLGMIQDGSLGVGPALFKVRTYSASGGDHPTAIHLDAEYGGGVDPTLSKGYTVASSARLRSYVYAGPPTLQSAVTELISVNSQAVQGCNAITRIIASVVNEQAPSVGGARVEVQSAGVFTADTKWYSQIEGVYFVPGGTDSTSDPSRYAFQELMLWLWSVGGSYAKVFLGPGYHNLNRTDAAPVTLGGVTVTGASNWGGGTNKCSIIYFESLDDDNYIQMSYGSTIEDCYFAASASMVNHEFAIKMGGDDNAIRNCKFMNVDPSVASGAGTGDGAVIFITNGGVGNIVENCRFLSTGSSRHIISVYNSYNTTIQSCFIGTDASGEDLLDAAIWIDATDVAQSSDICIKDNFIHLGNANGVQRCIDVDHYVQRCDISGNIVILEQAVLPGSAFFVNFYGTSTSNASNGYHRISGNKVIALQSTQYSNRALMTFQWNPNVLVSNNHIVASKWGYSQYSNAIMSTSGTPAENLKIVDNIFDAADCVAFYAAGSNEHYGYTIKGNTFKGCAGSYSGGVALSRFGAIRFGGGNVVGLIVEGNQIDFNQDDGGNTAINGALIETSGSGFTDCTISNNIVRKCKVGGAINHYAFSLSEYAACALNGNVSITGTTLFLVAATSSAYGDDGLGSPNGDTNI